jgi:hypothetical protein
LILHLMGKMKLGVFNDDGFDYIGRVFALVGYIFHHLVDFAFFNNFLRVRFQAEQTFYKHIADVIGLVFNAVDAYQRIGNACGCFSYRA